MTTKTNSWGNTEIYLDAEEITNEQQTIGNMLDRLMAESKKLGDAASKYTQLVIQLHMDKETGKEWKIFVYANIENNTYTYSYQDQDFVDSDFYRSVTSEFMLAKVMEEIHRHGFDWVALDF